jgi:hypothetical protein
MSDLPVQSAFSQIDWNQDPTIEAPEGKALHWLAVGYVSPNAQKWIEEVGGKVLVISDTIPLIAVGLAYDPHGAWVWSHGRREHRQGIAFWSSGEIQEASTGLHLLYRHFDCRSQAEYSSANETYLILPDEEFDPATKHVKWQEETEKIAEIPYEAVAVTEDLEEGQGDLNDHPF